MGTHLLTDEKVAVKILEKDKKKFDVVLLSANKNYKKLFDIAKKFKVKNIIISDPRTYKKLKKENKNKKIRNENGNTNNIPSILSRIPP